MAAKPVLKISYRNNTDEDIPPHAVLQFKDDLEVITDPADEDIVLNISVLVVKPDGEGDHFAIDDGKGATTEEDGGMYGQCIKALTGLFWVHYTKDDPPATAWETEVGPVAGEWYVDETGTGFVYAGMHQPDKDRILVMQKVDAAGATYGRALTEIRPATSHFVGWAFDFVRFIQDTSVTVPVGQPKHLKEQLDGDGEPKATKGVNRYTHIAGGADAFVIMQWINGEWTLVTLEDECPSD